MQEPCIELVLEHVKCLAAVSGEIFEDNPVKILVFPSPTSYML